MITTVGEPSYSRHAQFKIQLEYEFNIPRYTLYKKHVRVTLFRKRQIIEWHKIDAVFVGTMRYPQRFEDAKIEAIKLANFLEIQYI